MSDKPREWSLPLNTLIINSDFNRPNGVHVVEIEALRKVEAECDQLNQNIENADIIIRTLKADVKFWKNKAGEKE